MKKYYLHNGTESSGPFDIEELEAKKITKKTPVWFEGMEKWEIAGEIPELNSFFMLPISPLNPIIESAKPQNKEVSSQKKQILGLSKNTFFVALGILILIISTIIFNTLDNKRKRELDQKNHKTEIENYELELQEKKIKEQKIRIEEAEKQAKLRFIEEKKQASTEGLIEIEKLIAISQSNLESTKLKLKNATGFKIFRTAAEKKEQLYELQKRIDSIDKDIDRLKIESNQLKLDLEKIP